MKRNADSQKKAPLSLNEIARNSSERDDDKWDLRLYVAGQTPRSVAAFANLKRLCEEHLSGRYTIEVSSLGRTKMLDATLGVSVFLGEIRL